MNNNVEMMEYQFRSRIQQLPKELRVKIGEVSYQKQMSASQRRETLINLLKEYHIEFTELGTGTNRFIIKYDGYALKIALDQEGVADNKQEWVMSPLLAPHVAETYEISKGGHLLVASYAPAFTSMMEMNNYRSEIQSILKLWSVQYLLGDVGLTSINYANWGIYNRKPVCIDYAYIFPVGLNVFECVCGNKRMEFVDANYTVYQCTACKTKYTDRELRARISNEERIRLFSNTMEAGIELKSPLEYHLAPVPHTDYHNPSEPDMFEVQDMVVEMLKHRK
jgi:hypothetical protein